MQLSSLEVREGSSVKVKVNFKAKFAFELKQTQRAGGVKTVIVNIYMTLSACSILNTLFILAHSVFQTTYEVESMLSPFYR